MTFLLSKITTKNMFKSALFKLLNILAFDNP